MRQAASGLHSAAPRIIANVDQRGVARANSGPMSRCYGVSDAESIIGGVRGWTEMMGEYEIDWELWTWWQGGPNDS